MIRSMTGFASRTLSLSLKQETRLNLSISIKSLNSRFFETTCRLAYQLTHLEGKIIKKLSKKLYRGHVYVTVHMDNQALLKGSVQPAMSTIEGYIAAVESIKKKYPISGALDISNLLLLPHVFALEETTLDESTQESILNTIEAITDELIDAQEKEGLSLHHDLQQRASKIACIIDAVDHASLRMIEAQKNKIAVMLQESSSDDKQVEAQKMGAYALLDKIDVHEEIVRFKTHLSNLTDQLNTPDIEKGKRIDFTLQELGREINTITAKCCDAGIGTLGIDIKVELEKAREQAQNIV